MKRKRIQHFIIHLNEELGRGAFGAVYRGIDEKTNQPVAIKILSKNMLDRDEYVREAFMSQIKIMKKLVNQHIVRFVDVLVTPNNCYVIQELCDGGDLKSVLRIAKRLPEDRAIEYLRDICIGYQQLIKNSVIHRDIKPQNLLLHRGKLKLADFGFAKYVITFATLNATIVGTPLYMSPQILRRQKYTSKSDVWSLGVVFYEMLFGTLPWKANSQYQLSMAFDHVPLTFPKNIKISEQSMNFLTNCLKLKEQDRMSWLDIYCHPIFGSFFKPFVQKNKSLQEKAGYVINDLRWKINSRGINLLQLFNSKKYSHQTHLTKTQFFQLLFQLNNSLSEEEMLYVFVKFDKDSSGTIDFSQFTTLLEQSGIRITPVMLKQLQKKSTKDFGQPNMQMEVEEERPQAEEDKVHQAISNLRKKIEQHGLQFEMVYKSYDIHGNDTVSFDDFSKLIRKIDNTLSNDELALCFRKFDQDGDGFITYQQFFLTLSRITGDPDMILSRRKTAA